MANGKLVKMLLYTTVTKYLEWKCVDASYVYQFKEGGLFSNAKAVISKVPANDQEALKSDLMGLFEKKRCRNFFKYVQDYEEDDKSTWKDMNLHKIPMRDVFKKFSLEANTIDFVGHALAMYRDDSFLDQPAIDAINKIKLYMESIGKYGDSPFLYPIYGLGGIPEGFSRFCAIHGGTYMLNKNVDQILFNNGKVSGFKSGEEEAKAPIVICDPSYVLNLGKVMEVGKVIRAICILDHPIPNTKDVPSCQVIIPQKQVNRKYDIYINMVSYAHAVCSKDLYIAMISTTVETDKPELEIKPALELLGPVLEYFPQITPLYAPVSDAFTDNLYITTSFDATSHFETASEDVLQIYEKIVGEKLDLSVLPTEDEEY